MFRSHATLSASILCITLVIFSNAGIAAPAITWEVENGFRYFKRASDYREILRIYNSEKSAANPNPTALQLEIALEKAATQDGKFNGIEGKDRRLGWAASIYLHTCARQKDHMHRNCELEDHENYLEPKGTRIILHVEGVASGSCEWKIDGAVVGTGRCNDAENTGPLKPVTTRVSYNEKHGVTVTPSGGAAITGDITVRDILIVSFGDFGGEETPRSRWISRTRFPITPNRPATAAFRELSTVFRFDRPVRNSGATTPRTGPIHSAIARCIRSTPGPPCNTVSSTLTCR